MAEGKLIASMKNYIRIRFFLGYVHFLPPTLYFKILLYFVLNSSYFLIPFEIIVHWCFFFVLEFKIVAMPDDMWTPFKQLHRVVETNLSKRAPEGSLANLELTLHKHKSDFINLLKNSV